MSVIVLTLLPFCFSVKIRKHTAFVFHSPFANSLQRIDKQTAFACGECKGECGGLAISLKQSGNSINILGSK